MDLHQQWKYDCQHVWNALARFYYASQSLPYRNAITHGVPFREAPLVRFFLGAPLDIHDMRLQEWQQHGSVCTVLEHFKTGLLGFAFPKLMTSLLIFCFRYPNRILCLFVSPWE